MHRLTRLVALLLAVTALLLGPASGVAPFEEVSSTRRTEPSGLIFRIATSFAAAFTAMR